MRTTTTRLATAVKEFLNDLLGIRASDGAALKTRRRSWGKFSA